MNETTSLIGTLFRALSLPNSRQHLEDFYQRIGSSESNCRAAPDYWECLDFLATVERYSLRPVSHELILAALKMLVRRRTAGRPADSRSPWQEEYDRLAQSIAQAVYRSPGVELIVGTGEQVLVTFPLPIGAFERVVRDILPGRYHIGTDTGWQLWSGELLENDLCLGAAYPDRVVSLAAQDAPSVIRPARTLVLGETRLRADVFPGFESGAIRIYRPAEGGVE